MSRARAALLALLAAAALGGCRQPEPLRIGFIAELSGRSADIGESGRNGFLLAVEDARQAGLFGERPVEVLVRDVGASPEATRAAVGELLAAGVVAVVGPMNSNNVQIVQPLVEAAGVVEISPTASAMTLHGKDDLLFRINWTTRDNGRNYARHCHRRGLRRVAVAVNDNNRVFAQSWLEEFRSAFLALGGEVVAAPVFDSTASSHGGLVGSLLAPRPDGVVIVGNAADSARIAQQVRKQAPSMPLVAAEWAGAAQLLELGGRAVEGLMLAQNYNQADTSPRFTRFGEAYRKRFGSAPAYASVLSYDAGAALTGALSRRLASMPLKDALLRLGPFDGLQQPLRFDRNGDAERPAYFLTVRDGRFVPD